MTLYLWTHWFWITHFLASIYSRDVLTTQVSFLTEQPLNTSESNRTAKSIGSISIPPTVTVPPTVRTVTASRNVSNSKPTKSSMKKFEALFPSNITNKIKEVREPVIQKNLTDVNATVDNQYLFNAINYTNNTTYLEEESIFNQSYALNAEHMGVDERDGSELKVSSGNLTAAGITGITLGCVIIVGVISGVSYFIYRNQGFNRPQVLNDRCSNPDSSGYIDDASVRDNSEEMYSLDNDSFLNSLEAMTIQNYWTDTVKHTKL